MKKLIPLILIITLLFTSCQLKGDFSIPEASVSVTEEPATALFTEYLSVTETVTEEHTAANIITAVSSSIASTLAAISPVKPSQPKTTVAATERQTEKTTVKPTAKPTAVPTKATTKPATKPQTTAAPLIQTELRGIWISCYDHISAAGKTREQYKASTDTMFRNIKNMGLDTAFVHLRAFSDAFYKSDIYPYSSYIAGTEGADLPFDPFAVMLESAKQYGISVHGWINPFRVSTKNDPSLLSAKNPAKAILDAGNENGEICILSNGIYYNPSCPSNHGRIIDGVREIISKYDIDGIHIDDYFYPSTDSSVDKKQYSQYKAEGGTLGLADWRRSCVNAFVSALYSAVKAADSTLTVSISPAGQLDKNYDEYYADCELWLSHAGYADLIIPQIYFGFEHETLAFSSLLKKWSSLPRAAGVELACGIAAYKCATTDKFAGTGSAEWKNKTDILSRQLNAIRGNKNYGGFVVFSYQDLNRTACKTEINNLKNTITGNS
ncbi:MAG: family 10 glycosylhydrolase [Clostridia bacterium]|nr:family 10 glycosylhydrolase [Clostridia bacterium]